MTKPRRPKSPARMSVIRHRDIAAIIEARDGAGQPRPFNGRVFTTDGRVLELRGVTCTSSYHGKKHGVTYNLKFPDSGEIRKAIALFFIEINGKEVIL